MRVVTFIPPHKAFVFRNKPVDFSPSVEVAACYIECSGKYLLLKRSIGRPQQNTWGLPAGKLEEGESPLEAVFREVFEEVGVELCEKELDDVGKIFVRYSHQDFVYHMFHQVFSHFPEISLSDEHQDYSWVSFEEALSKPLISGGEEAIHHFQALARKPKLCRKDFYFIRHGETDGGGNPNIKQRDDDFPLNAKGKAQAFAVCEMLKGVHLKTVCSSPMLRAQETKDIVTDSLDVEHFEIRELSECKADIWTKMVRLEEGRDYRVCEEVENFLSQALHGINTALQKDGPTLIVAHGGIHWAMCYYTMIENHPWRIDNCKLVHFFPEGTNKWRASFV